MKNLTPLRRKLSYWDDIVNSKHLASKTPLLAIRNDVSSRFSAYKRHTNPMNLEGISVSPFITPTVELLIGCYSNSNNLSLLKTKIKEKQNILIRSECQYCNIGEPTTFDHYLPKTDFPEFSVLSTNLIPCCSYCNIKKGDVWQIHGKRTTINFYYDIIPTVSYLICTIVYKKNIPQAEFHLNSAILPINIRTEFTNHFTRLNLTERYKEKSNNEITDVYNTIQPLSAKLTRLEIQDQLRNDAKNMKITRGHNYWRAILKIELSNSNRFLTEAGY